MIADVVNLAIMSIAFCHAAVRLTAYRSFAAAVSAVFTQNRMR
jgi:hypothetical protein